MAHRTQTQLKNTCGKHEPRRRRDSASASDKRIQAFSRWNKKGRKTRPQTTGKTNA
ncbi:hypothetical protein ACFQ95_22120 [Variovorax sp. HJSM1_2]